jgi:tripartite-type tricarboxylate transporter receptor subunit TctC
MNIKNILACLTSLLLLNICGFSQAQSWPGRPVKIVVPYAAGGGVDPVARLVSLKLAEIWKQPVVVENKAGGSGTIGANFVAKSPADGLTILMSATAEVVINQHFMQKMTYNPDVDLKPVTLLVKLPFVLVANPSKPYSSAAELIAYAKKNPNTVTYASSGPGTPQHLSAVMLEEQANIKLIHVPYKGVAPSVSDLLAGHVDIGFAGLPTALPYIQSGALKALGLSSKIPSIAAPNIPPLAKTPGLQNFDLTQWFGVYVPSATPNTISQKIQRDIVEVLKMPDVKEALEKQGAQPGNMTMDEFQAFSNSESKKFGAIVKSAKIDQN